MPQYISNNLSPIPNQTFIWYAKYNNDIPMLTEFEDDGKENEFNDINKEELKEFGLLGNGGKVYFNTNDGVIHLDNEREANIFLENENGITSLTKNDNVKYNDIIQYKKGFLNYDPTVGDRQSKLNVAINYIGYKARTYVSAMNVLSFQIIYGLPMGEPNFFIVKLNSEDVNYKGKIVLTYGGNRDEAPIELKKNKVSTFEILF